MNNVIVLVKRRTEGEGPGERHCLALHATNRSAYIGQLDPFADLEVAVAATPPANCVRSACIFRHEMLKHIAWLTTTG